MPNEIFSPVWEPYGFQLLLLAIGVTIGIYLLMRHWMEQREK